MRNRALQWMAQQFAFLVVLVLLAAAFGYLVVEPSRRWGFGAGAASVAVLLAGVLRAVLPARRVGLLVVRSRWLDAACYLALGGAILAVDIRLHT